jgi:hypothetical protein
MSRFLFQTFRVLISVMIPVICTLVCMSQERMEEFNGPFTSWANVITRFGARGDGKHDDTKAIQLALDSLSNRLTNFNQGKNAYSVVYFPAGVYKITSTLVLKAKMGVRIIGADPVTTKISWQGADNDTVFWANGSAYFSLSRLGWDAGGRKNMEAIGLHWKLQKEGYAPEQVEFTDHVFNGFAKGISGGTLGGNDGSGSNESEITIRRCTFNDCSVSGILIRGYNALDYWVWHCRFIRCKVGVTSNSGNYHVYQSYFNRSSTSDVYNNNSYYTSVRFCYSENSSAFSLEEGSSSNPFKRIFEGNIVTGITNIGISYTHAGKITMINNVFIAGAGVASKRFLEYGSWAPSHFDLLDMNNTIEGFPSRFNIAQPSRIFTGSAVPLRHSVPTSATFLSTLPPTPPFRQRNRFEVPPNAGGDVMQGVIDKAAAMKRRAVVHFSYGIYNLDKPLTIPVNADIQILGDGYLYCSTIFKSASNEFVNGAALKIICPTTVSIRDLEFDLSGGNRDNGRAIVLIGGDQPGSVALLDQLYADNDTSLLVKDYDYTVFQKTNSFFTTGNHVAGGKLLEKGAGTSRVQCFGAQFANCTLVKNGCFIARDCWWEGTTSIPLNLSGNGRFILDGAMIAPRKLDSSTVISIHGFSGKITLTDMYVIGSLDVKTNNPNLQLLVWNTNFYYKKRPLAFLTGNEPYKAFFGGISTQCFNNKDPECAGTIITPDAAVNVASADNFMQDMTGEFQLALPLEYVAKPAGVSNFYLSRVAVSAKYKTGIAFTR